MTLDPAQQGEAVRQNNLAYVGLIGLGLILVQPLLTAPELDRSAQVCAVAFAVAIPLLAALVMVAQQETFRGRVSRSWMVNGGKTVGQLAAFVGLVAGFWHIWWVAGVTILAASVVAMGVHSAGYVELEGSTWSSRAVTAASSRKRKGAGPSGT